MIKLTGMPAIEPVTVVLGDGHRLFLDALETALSQRGLMVTVAQTAAEMIDAVARHRPHVCLIDYHFGGADGLATIAQVISASEETKVLVLSADPGGGGVSRALRMGASGYLHKTRGIAALTEAIRRVMRGEVVVDVPGGSGIRAPGRGSAQRLAAFLTDREWECLGLLVEGLDTTRMAARIGVSRATARTHVQSLLTKLGVHSRLEAATYAVRYGLLDYGPWCSPGMQRESPAERMQQGA